MKGLKELICIISMLFSAPYAMDQKEKSSPLTIILKTNFPEFWIILHPLLDHKSFSRLARVNKEFHQKCLKEWPQRPIDLTYRNGKADILTFIFELMINIPNPNPFNIKLKVSEAETPLLSWLGQFDNIDLIVTSFKRSDYDPRITTLSNRLKRMRKGYSTYSRMLQDNDRAKRLNSEKQRIFNIIHRYPHIDTDFLKTLNGKNISSLVYLTEPIITSGTYTTRFYQSGTFLKLSFLKIDSRFFSAAGFETLKPLQNLKALDLSISPDGNPINIPRSFENFKALTTLTSLNLSGFCSKISNGFSALSSLTNLTYLNLNQATTSGENQPKNVQDLTFLLFHSNLVYLDLSKNLFTSLDSLKNLTNLQSLGLSHSQIPKEIFYQLPDLPSLDTLDVSHNPDLYDFTFSVPTSTLKEEFNLSELSVDIGQAIQVIPFPEESIHFFHPDLFPIFKRLPSLTSLTIGSSENL